MRTSKRFSEEGIFALMFTKRQSGYRGAYWALSSSGNCCDYYEVFPASGANKFALVEDIEVDDQGLVYAPEKPGLGYDIDWELVKRETVQVVK